MDESRLKPYEEMWTSEAFKYVIVDLDAGGAMIFDTVGHGAVVIDDDSGVYELVVERMLDAGVRRIRPTDLPPYEG
jgi:hypothetical protein